MPHDDPGVPGPEPAETEWNVFDDLVRKRTRLVGKLSALTCLFFFPLPILGQFTDVLDGVVGSGITWAWIYAFVQFPVALFAAARYSVRARELDRASEQAWKERS